MKLPPSPMKLNGNAQLANRRRWSLTTTLSSRTIAIEAQRRRLELADRDAQSSTIATLWARRSRLWARRSWRSELADRDFELADRDALSSLIARLSSQIATLKARRSRRCWSLAMLQLAGDVQFAQTCNGYFFFPFELIFV